MIKNYYLKVGIEAEISKEFETNIDIEYEVKVLNDIEKIEVLAVPEKSTSKVEVKKDDVLKDGENIIVVTVTSEKETTRSYTIKVIRLGKKRKWFIYQNNSNRKNS